MPPLRVSLPFCRGRRGDRLRDGVGLATRAATALGLPPNRETESSIVFTLVGATGRAAAVLLAASASFCVASSFFTGAFVSCIGENCALR